MRLMNHLRKTTDGTWEVRIVVPPDVRNIIGKNNLTKRLGRVTKSEANKLAAPVVAGFQFRIAQARGEPVAEAADGFTHPIWGKVTIHEPSHVPAVTSGKTVDDLIAAYEAEKWNSWSESSKRSTRPVFRFLRDVFPRRDIATITRDDARDAVTLLCGLPRGWGKIQALKGRSVKAIVEKGGKKGLPLLTPKTINDGYLLHIASMWNWAVKETWLTSTPWRGLTIADPIDDENRRDPFTVEQLNILFGQGVWKHRWSPDRIDAAEYWVPILALFHGLRLSEAMGLALADITDGDIPMIHIRGHDGRRLKTAGSRASLAIHPELLRLGFLSFAKSRNNSATMMFVNSADDVTAASRRYGGQFVALVKRLGLHGRKLGMHSFRHNFEDAVRNAELEERTALALARRAESGSSRIYGAGLSDAKKREAIAKVVYRGRNINHLYE